MKLSKIQGNDKLTLQSKDLFDIESYEQAKNMLSLRQNRWYQQVTKTKANRERKWESRKFSSFFWKSKTLGKIQNRIKINYRSLRKRKKFAEEANKFWTEKSTYHKSIFNTALNRKIIIKYYTM